MQVRKRTGGVQRTEPSDRRLPRDTSPSTTIAAACQAKQARLMG